jgi:hypothetical protein
VRLLHSLPRTAVSFDEPNLVSHAGLVPVLALAERAGLPELLARVVRPPGPCGVNPAAKVGCLFAAMAAGADSIDDTGVLRHGATARVFGGLRAPSTLGSHLRSYNWGNVAQLEKASRGLLARLARLAPLLSGAAGLAFIDIDSTQKRVYGYAKQGARFGVTKIASKQVKVRGLNPLVTVISTPASAPVVAGTRLRGGNAASARGAASMVYGAVATARACGCTGLVIVRGDSAYYTAAVVAAARAQGARFSLTVPKNAKVSQAIAAIGETAWTTIRYPRAVFDEQLGCWVSEAEVAETPYTAFANGKDKAARAVTARLIVRRVREQNKAPQGQEELFPAWRYHAVFTDNPHDLVTAEAEHRDHAIVEQVSADLSDGPLAHLPSGKFTANAAWLTIAAITRNLLRAAGTLAGQRLARARAATVRAALVAVPARAARHGRGRLTLHLPAGWHRQTEWNSLWQACTGPPPAAA